MKKHLNKIFSCLVAIVMFMGFSFILTACGDTSDPEVKTTKVVNISLNPSVEFVLDKDNKIVTVNAKNDEGNFVIANASFTVGDTINEAVEKFLEVTKTNGFIVEGEQSKLENQLIIEVSGKEANSLYNQIKTKANEYLSAFDIEYTATYKKITKAQLVTLVRESMKDILAVDVLRMNETQLIELIKNSRQETKNLYSQQLKDLYYELRAQEILEAKFEAVKAQIETLVTLPDLSFVETLLGIDLSAYSGETTTEKFVNYLNEKISSYTTEINNFKNSYLDNILNSDEYTTAFNNYIEAKQTLLEARLNGETTSQELENLETLLSEAEIDFYGDEEGLNSDGLQSAVAKANQTLTSIQESITNVQLLVENAVEQFISFLDSDVVELAEEQAKEQFATIFNNDSSIKTFIDNSREFWNNLKPNVA